MSSYLKCTLFQVDSRVFQSCVALLMREYPDGKWREAEDLFVRLIEKSDRVDFYDRPSLKAGRDALENLPVERLKEALGSLPEA